MKFQTPLLLLASLVTYVSAEAAGTSTAVDARSHPREFVTKTVDLSSRAAPALPEGADDKRLYVWIRTDTRPLDYDERGGANHEGLNQLMRDTGGRHKDLVVGDGKNYREYGLEFSNSDWQSKPNGDGAEINAYHDDYNEVKNGQETYEYRGMVANSRLTLRRIDNNADREIKDKVYNHESYNCATFAENLAAALVNGS